MTQEANKALRLGLPAKRAPSEPWPPASSSALIIALFRVKTAQTDL